MKLMHQTHIRTNKYYNSFSVENYFNYCRRWTANILSFKLYEIIRVQLEQLSPLSYLVVVAIIILRCKCWNPHASCDRNQINNGKEKKKHLNLNPSNESLQMLAFLCVTMISFAIFHIHTVNIHGTIRVRSLFCTKSNVICIFYR